jgi:phosphate starvation-inducible PhoH-like protein
MKEKVFALEMIDPVEIFGVNESNLELMRKFYPKLKLISRGDIVKAIGDKTELDQFEERFEILLKHYEKFGRVSEKDVEYIMDPRQTDQPATYG